MNEEALPGSEGEERGGGGGGPADPPPEGGGGQAELAGLLGQLLAEQRLLRAEVAALRLEQQQLRMAFEVSDTARRAG